MFENIITLILIVAAIYGMYRFVLYRKSKQSGNGGGSGSGSGGAKQK